MASSEERKQQIINDFQQILAERENIDLKIATKAEEVAKSENQLIVNTASTYTSDDIVKGLANLQIEFGGIVTNLSERLRAELTKLDELEQAIEIETQHLKELHQIRIVADALHLITQEHQDSLRTLEQETTEQQETLRQEMTEQRLLWQKEQTTYETAQQEQNELLIKERQRQEADYQYNLERTRTIAANEYEEQKRNQEQELQEANQAKEQEWSEREAILEENLSLVDEYQQQVQQFSTELEAAVTQARTESELAATRSAEVKAELIEKEWNATQQGYEFQIQSVETQIQQQLAQIEILHTQLQDTLKQSQALTIRAFGSS